MTLILYFFALVDSPNSSYASLPRDGEGFDDLDAYFNRASTPQKTPKSQRKSQNDITSTTGSRIGTPSSHLKAASSVLVAKPLKMISSKIAEHYKKEPRLEVSMSEAEAEMRQREMELELELERERERERELEREQERELELQREQESELQRGQERELQHEQRHQMHNSSADERIQRAKRELEEMSINSSFDYNTHENHDNHTEVNIASYIKSVPAANEQYEFMPENDDVLMDRLVEEMLVNDQEYESAQANEDIVQVPVSEETHTEAAGVFEASKLKAKGRKPRGPTSGGLARRAVTYGAGTELGEDGLRRSCRMKMEPLRFWANEKVCYGRADDPSITLPVIVNVIKKPELDDPTFTMGLTRKRRRPVDPNVAKLRAQGYGPDCDVETEVVCHGRHNESETRLVALSHNHVQGDEVKDCSFRIHTIFTEGAYMSSGQLIFPPGSQKPTKNSHRHALVFYVISGSFRVEINQESFLIGAGGQFHVPRSNYYTISHVTPPEKGIEGRLFFCHCKDNAD